MNFILLPSQYSKRKEVRRRKEEVVERQFVQEARKRKKEEGRGFWRVRDAWWFFYCLHLHSKHHITWST